MGLRRLQGDFSCNMQGPQWRQRPPPFFSAWIELVNCYHFPGIALIFSAKSWRLPSKSDVYYHTTWVWWMFLFNLHYSPVQWYQLYVLSALSFVIQQVRFAFVLSGLGILNGYKQMLPSWNELLPVILPVSNIWKEIFSIQRKFSALGGHTDICLLQLHTIRFHWILLLQE